MKKIIYFVIVLVLFVSCQEPKEKLELNLTKGEVYSQKMTSAVSIIQTINGQQTNMNITIFGKMTYKVLDIVNSIYEMEVRYESLSMKMNLPNGEAEFNSENNDDKDIYSSILSKMTNKPFLVKMTKTGKINEVKNIESIFENVFENFPQLTDMQKQQIKNQFIQSYGEKAFKGNIEMCSAIFSDSLVSKGDKWV